jgi:hypothetical protein
MASPHVCGAGALLRTVNPQLTNLESRVALRLATDDLGTPGYDDSFGFGRLDVKKAVDAARRDRAVDARRRRGPAAVTVTMDAPTEANMVQRAARRHVGQRPGPSTSSASTARLPARAAQLRLPFFEFQLTNPNNAVTPGFIDYLDANGQDERDLHVISGKIFRARRSRSASAPSTRTDLSHVRFISAPLSFDVP